MRVRDTFVLLLLVFVCGAACQSVQCEAACAVLLAPACCPPGLTHAQARIHASAHPLFMNMQAMELPSGERSQVSDANLQPTPSQGCDHNAEWAFLRIFPAGHTVLTAHSRVSAAVPLSLSARDRIAHRNLSQEASSPHPPLVTLRI